MGAGLVPFLRCFGGGGGGCVDFLPIPFPLPATPPCPQKCTFVGEFCSCSGRTQTPHPYLPSSLPRNALGSLVC